MAENISSAAELAGKRIVTSFPVIAEQFFRQFETEQTGKTKIKFVSGSVEAACQLGMPHTHTHTHTHTIILYKDVDLYIYIRTYIQTYICIYMYVCRYVFV